MTRPEYLVYANRAIAAQLPPASPEMTCGHFRELGVTRQTAWNWRQKPEGPPNDARMAVAWIMKHGAD